MDINQLKTLDTIVSMKSFNKAAERCFVSTSTLTRQVTAMETEIGFPIFERSAFGVTLTPQGEAFYRQTLSIPQLYESAVSSALSVGPKKQIVRISIFSYMRKYVTRACEVLKDQEEGIDFSFVSCQLRESSAALLNHRTDIALFTDIQDTDDRLFVLPILHCSNCVIVSSSHPLAKRTRVRSEELDGQTFLLSARAMESKNIRAVKRLLRGACPHSRFVEYQHPDQADALCQINGYPILSLSFLEANEGFRKVLIADAPNVLIGAACRKEDLQRYLPLMERFRDYIIQNDDFIKNTTREELPGTDLPGGVQI